MHPPARILQRTDSALPLSISYRSVASDTTHQEACSTMLTRLVEAVRLDAAHVVWLHSMQLCHQLCQLLFELAANAVELEGSKSLVGCTPSKFS